MIKMMLIAWVATIGFAIVFNIPRRDLLFAGFAGSIGWLIYLWVNEGVQSKPVSTFAAALAVGVIGELLARIFKKPVTVYVIPGILPLVPGYSLYRAIVSIIMKDYSKAADTGFEALLVALAIASGIIIASSGGKFMNDRHKRLSARGNHGTR